MAKTDICSAFRNVPVHPTDWELLGMHWKGLYFFDKVLPFGLRSAPFIFNQLSDALEWIAKTNYDIKHILDDFFLIEPPLRSNCMTSLCKLLTLMTNLNVPIPFCLAVKKVMHFTRTPIAHQYTTICMPRRSARPRFLITHDKSNTRGDRAAPSYYTQFGLSSGRCYVACFLRAMERH